MKQSKQPRLCYIRCNDVVILAERAPPEALPETQPPVQLHRSPRRILLRWPSRRLTAWTSWSRQIALYPDALVAQILSAATFPQKCRG